MGLHRDDGGGETSCGRPDRRVISASTVENSWSFASLPVVRQQPVGVNQKHEQLGCPASHGKLAMRLPRVEQQGAVLGQAKTFSLACKEGVRAVQFYQHIVFGVGMGDSDPTEQLTVTLPNALCTIPSGKLLPLPEAVEVHFPSNMWISHLASANARIGRTNSAVVRLRVLAAAGEESTKIKRRDGVPRRVPTF